MRIITILFIFLIIQINFAKEADIEISKIEQEVQKIIKENKIPDQKLFYFYSLAARNLLKENYSDLAIKYYQKALEIKAVAPVDYLKAQFELAMTFMRTKKFDQIKALNLEIESHIKKNNLDIKNDSYATHTIDYLKVVASPNKTVQETIGVGYQRFYETIYNDVIIARELEVLMKRSLFAEALSIFQGQTPKASAYYDFKIAFDLLNLLQEKPYKPICQVTPNDKGTLVDICNVIHGKKANKEKLIEQASKDELISYLVPALKKQFKLPPFGGVQ